MSPLGKGFMRMTSFLIFGDTIKSLCLIYKMLTSHTANFMTLSPITPHLPNGINCARFSFILYQYLNRCCRPHNKICEIWFATKRFRKVHSPSKSTCNSLQLIKSFTSNFFEKVHPKWSG